jgi:hypothetical protein
MLLLLLQVIELCKQNTDLEEEALALEQKLSRSWDSSNRCNTM